MSSYPILQGNPLPCDVVTRFPPEPSGHLHIGHCKAIFINKYYAHEYDKTQRGKFILRFDDTNPTTEKDEYEDAILVDLQLLGVIPDQITHTSDYFKEIQDEAYKLIINNMAYVDITDQEEMASCRGKKEASSCRDNTLEQNIELWKMLLKGSPYVLRAKIEVDGIPGYKMGNGSMRDPVLYRCKEEAHARTGIVYKAYPTYDMACPYVDSIEGVTHVFRDSQYSDRTEQYKWLQAAMNLRPCYIQLFSRINFKQTLMSKRKLSKLIDDGIAEGWDDPRFPTIKGIIRRGLSIKSLKTFIISQGTSTKNVEMEWDKIWSSNTKLLEPSAPRFMCVSEKYIIIDIINTTVTTLELPLVPKYPEYGTKIVNIGNKILIDDIQLKVGLKIGLMRYCVIQIINNTTAEIIGNNFKETDILVNWVSVKDTKATILEYDYLINDKEEINDKSVTSFEVIVNSCIKDIPIGTVIQFEKRGLFIVDKPMVFIKIPDGRKTYLQILYSLFTLFI